MNNLKADYPCNFKLPLMYFVLVHYVALRGNHGIVQITHCRWRYGSLVMQCPLSLLQFMRYQLVLSMTYQLILSMMYKFQSCLGNLWVIKPTNQVSIAL